MSKEITYKQVWDTLRAVDCSKVVVQKMNLDYIGWADAWSLPIMTASMPMKSIPERRSRDISDGQARCFVKAMGLFGLGLHLWEKRDVKQPKRSELHDKPF